ncbi:MAG: AI-2E family transporter [Alphaproteobacteria bacterium]
MHDDDASDADTARKDPVPDGLSVAEVMDVLRGTTPVSITGMALLAFLYTAYFAAGLFLPILFAIFLSIMMHPLVQAMKRLGIPRAIAALVVVIGLFSLLTGAMAQLSTPAEQWLQRLPSIQRELEAKLWPVTRSIEQAKVATEKIQDLADGDTASTEKPEVTVKERSLLSRIFETTWLTVVQVLIVFALTFFFLAQDNEKTRNVIRNLPLRKHRESVEEIFESVQRTITRFLQISAAIYVSLGVVTTLGMYFLNMPNPILWGCMATVFGFMPFVGPLIVFGCIAMVSLLTFDHWWHFVAPPALYGGLTIVEGYFITPAVVGRHLTVSPIAIFLSMLLWTWVWGMAGALLAVPILVVLTTVARHLIVIMRDRKKDRPEPEYEERAPLARPT